MTSELEAITPIMLESHIFSIRGKQVMIDRDLAQIYQVEVKRLNEQVKRNIERFPESFRFKLTNNENLELVANCDRFKNLKHSTTTPHVFTKYGVETKSFNCAVKKNKNRFPASFRFQLTLDEYDSLRRQIGTSNNSLLNRMEFIDFQQIQNDKSSFPCPVWQYLLITKKDQCYGA